MAYFARPVKDQFDADGTSGDDVLPSGAVEHEFPIDGLFAPCDARPWPLRELCGDRERVIRFVPGNFGKALYCANGHHHKFEGKTFIPAEEFGRYGRFANVLPEELRPNDDELKSKRWKISKRVKTLLQGRAACAACGAVEINTWENPDPGGIWDWLTEHDQELLAEVQRELQQSPGVELQHWWHHISVELREAIRNRTAKSLLQFDHGIPRKTGNEFWWRFSRRGRLFLQESLIFKMCRKCNDEKSSKLLDREELVRRYVSFHFDGSLAAAMHDARWGTFMEVLEVVYGSGRVAV